MSIYLSGQPTDKCKLLKFISNSEEGEKKRERRRAKERERERCAFKAAQRSPLNARGETRGALKINAHFHLRETDFSPEAHIHHRSGLDEKQPHLLPPWREQTNFCFDCHHLFFSRGAPRSPERCCWC